MGGYDTFSEDLQKRVTSMAQDRDFLGLSKVWIRESIRYNYAQNFSWLGRPIVQVPTDVYAIQEIIWQVKPDLIIETGIAHGGSLILSASMLALIDYCEAVEQGHTLDPKKSKRCVLGIDVDIRSHNREAIEKHPLVHLIKMIEGSSIDSEVVDQVKVLAKNYKKILIFLDSNHTQDHVFNELEAYATLTSVGSYCVAWDTGIEDLPAGFCSDRPWDKGNNPKTAVWKYLGRLENEAQKDAGGRAVKFEVDQLIERKLMITAAPNGFLKRVA